MTWRRETAPITASMLRDMTLCEHRVALDLHGDSSSRDVVGAFTAMLWAEGCEHESRILADVAPGSLDLRGMSGSEREVRTSLALERGEGTILGGRIRYGDLLGDPDVLRGEAAAWVAGDVKSGSANEDGRPRRAYSAQVAHYAAILVGLGAGDGATAFVVDRHGASVDYALDRPAGPRSPAPREAHAALLARARAIRDGASTRPALAAECKGCHWKSLCKARLGAEDDLTLVAELGRAARDALATTFPTVAALALVPVSAIDGGPFAKIKGVGAGRLSRFAERARLLVDPGAGAYARSPLPLARADHEFFLDVEADPLAGDVVYLHGILERRRTGGDEVEIFHGLFADDDRTGEREAFRSALAVLASKPDAPIYVYSAYERTSYRTLQARYPDVCGAGEIEALFAPERTVDLLTAIVRPLTEWPASDRSIKSLARLCGFTWRDSDPSGANSIEWYRSWQASRDPATRQRIIDYNEDDVIATRVLLDALLNLPVRLC